jgi:hypothetical protein
MGEKWPVLFSLTMRLPRHCRVLLHATNLRHGTDYFTSPPKEGMLRIFAPEKSDGFGRVRTRDLGYQRAACSRLALDHRSRCFHAYFWFVFSLCSLFQSQFFTACNLELSRSIHNIFKVIQ